MENNSNNNEPPAVTNNNNCPSNANSEPSSSMKEFILAAFDNQPRDAHQLWQKLPTAWKMDDDIKGAAWKAGQDGVLPDVSDSIPELYDCYEHHRYSVWGNASVETLLEFMEQIFQYCINHETCIDRGLDIIRQAVLPEQWKDRTFCLKYCRAGIPFEETYFPVEHRNDKELWLASAAALSKWRENNEDFHWSRNVDLPFYCLPDTLVKDKDFLLEMLELDKDVSWNVVSRSACTDFDVLAKIISQGWCDDVFDWLHDGKKCPEFVHKLQEELDSYVCLPKGVLCAMQLSNPKECALARLNQGVETTRKLKRILADYCGVPPGKRLKTLRQAKREMISNARYRSSFEKDCSGCLALRKGGMRTTCSVSKCPLPKGTSLGSNESGIPSETSSTNGAGG